MREYAEYSVYSPVIMRASIGLMFIVAGLSKLFDPSSIIGLLKSIGFPLPLFFGWIVLLSEIFFGIAVLVGWKLKYTVWPLAIILLVATITVALPGISSQPLNFFFHVIGISGLISLFFTGPGKWHT